MSGPKAVPPPARAGDALGVRHLAFRTGSYQALREAYDTLLAHGVYVQRMIDHVSQRSLYFADPDGNQLEIYYEYPNARDLFRQGRGDRDTPFTWQDPLPPLGRASKPSDGANTTVAGVTIAPQRRRAARMWDSPTNPPPGVFSGSLYCHTPRMTPPIARTATGYPVLIRYSFIGRPSNRYCTALMVATNPTPAMSPRTSPSTGPLAPVAWTRTASPSIPIAAPARAIT